MPGKWQNENWPYAAHREEVQATDIHFLVLCNNFGMPPSDTSSAAFLTKPLTPFPSF